MIELGLVDMRLCRCGCRWPRNYFSWS